MISGLELVRGVARGWGGGAPLPPIRGKIISYTGKNRGKLKGKGEKSGKKGKNSEEKQEIRKTTKKRLKFKKLSHKIIEF